TLPAGAGEHLNGGRGAVPPPVAPVASRLPWLRLDPVTICEVLGDQPDEHDLAILRFDVVEAVARLEAGIRAGRIPPRQLVRGRPLTDWLDVAEIARLLRLKARAEDRP